MPYSERSGVKIWYEVAGQGPPFVFVHANPFDHNLWLYQVAHFSTRFRTIAVDLRAYGRSDKPVEPYGFDAVCDDIIGVCAAEGVETAVLAGASIGSKIAYQLALDHADMFDAVIQVGGSAGRGRSYDGRIKGYSEQGPGAYRKPHMEELVAPGFTDTALGRYLLDCALENTPRLDGAAIARLFHSFDDVDLLSRMPDFAVPVLIVNGEHDGSLPGALETAALIPGAVHKVIPNAGHVCNLEDPATFDRHVTEFLGGLGLMPGA